MGVDGLGSEAPGTRVLVNPHGSGSREVGRGARSELSRRAVPASPINYKEVKTD